ncbi:glycoside hydrolase family 3 N-terminal domain-containing protein [Arcobacter sp. YIC-464]|uniref:glycoside hydrolase family 3 N-terminal domain-containing protein n=1 Tax=Arcobacter sp. YIC-464 TaxID=3376631 RepID=UPI003C2A5936
MIKKLFVLTLLISSLFANENYSKKQIENMIAKMVVLGFNGTDVSSNDKIYKDIKNYNLGGVILFDKDPNDKTKRKNIVNPTQLKTLTSKLQSIKKDKLLISIDQEGGIVQRLKPAYGFTYTSSAQKVSSMGEGFARQQYQTLAKQLKENGINLNFAPVVDLAVNSKNKVIYKLKRSYGKDPNEVVKYASIFVEESRKQGVISVLKHFPGHGSSYGDSHKGFVDVTKTWKQEEMKPYENLIQNNKVDMIMSAHVFNKEMDRNYPATLSYDINTIILRDMLNYQGVLISDDLQMKAISSHYSLEDTVTLAINSGVNILLFANQLAKPVKLETIINTVYSQIQKGKISLDKIVDSNKKIEKLLQKI